MSTYSDSWAAGPLAEMPPLPPRPDIDPAIAVGSAPLAMMMDSYRTAEAWQRVGAVLGVIWAFFFFLTIPGWLALSRYRRWKRGETKTPFGLIWWGYGFGALFLCLVIASSIS